MQRLATTPLANSSNYTQDQKQTFITNFRDDLGNRRPVDAPLLCRLLIVPFKQISTPVRNDELQLWQAQHSNTDPLTLVAPSSTTPSPLFPHLHHLAIELWTESELSGLHALSHFAATSQNPAIPARMRSAAAWLLDNIQPDNATQRPWAIHVFLLMANDTHLSHTVRSNAQMYADTLLHNAMIPMGPQVPDIFSACILLDSATLM